MFRIAISDTVVQNLCQLPIINGYYFNGHCYFEPAGVQTTFTDGQMACSNFSNNFAGTWARLAYFKNQMTYDNVTQSGAIRDSVWIGLSTQYYTNNLVWYEWIPPGPNQDIPLLWYPTSFASAVNRPSIPQQDAGVFINVTSLWSWQIDSQNTSKNILCEMGNNVTFKLIF